MKSDEEAVSERRKLRRFIVTVSYSTLMLKRLMIPASLPPTQQPPDTHTHIL